MASYKDVGENQKRGNLIHPKQIWTLSRLKSIWTTSVNYCESDVI